MIEKYNSRSVHPGEVLREEYMGPLGLNATQLARALHVSVPTVNELRRGRRSVTVDMAMRLARYFRTTPNFWMNLQVLHDFDEARDRKVAAVIRREVRPRKEA